MPILRVEIVGAPQEFPDDIAQSIADQAGAALDSPPRGTWVVLEFTPHHCYAENGGRADGVIPVIVSLLQADPPPADLLRHQITRLTDAIASATAIPSENVHVIVEPGARGRIALGGAVVE